MSIIRIDPFFNEGKKDGMQVKNELFSQKIGNLEVHEEQAECSKRIIDEFRAESGPPILIAQAQQGKTETALYCIEQLVKHWEGTGESYEVIYLINLSDNELKKQTRKRLMKAHLNTNKRIRVIQHAELKKLEKFEIDDTADYRFIIIDECHYALGKKRPLDNFFSRCGIKYGRPIDEWDNKKNFVLSISATPFAATIKSYLDERCFSRIILRVSDNYYSVQDAWGNGRETCRFFDSDKLIKDKAVTPFYESTLNEFLLSCENSGNGYQIVRCQKDERVGILKDYVESRKENRVNILTYSAKENNLDELDDQLSMMPAKPTVIVVRGALRAGKTLSTTRYIRQWIEPHSAIPDATYQAIGRCFGYASEDGYSRSSDRFPIYCNRKVIEQIIRFYDENKCVPKGAWNSSAVDKILEYEIKFASTFHEIPEEYRGDFFAAPVSHQRAHNAADEIIRAVKPSGRSPVYHIDGPPVDSNGNMLYPTHWMALMERYPECLNRYVYYVPVETPIAKISFSDKINEDSMLVK